jgi:hypothetical protein
MKDEKRAQKIEDMFGTEGHTHKAVQLIKIRDTEPFLATCDGLISDYCIDLRPVSSRTGYYKRAETRFDGEKWTALPPKECYDLADYVTLYVQNGQLMTVDIDHVIWVQTFIYLTEDAEDEKAKFFVNQGDVHFLEIDKETGLFSEK